MKPRQLADIIGFVSYFYAVNRRLPERDLVQRVLDESERGWAYLDRRASDRPSARTRRGTPVDADVWNDSQLELAGRRQ